MEKHIIKNGDIQIEFILERKNVKNINLNVKPDMKIVVSASNEVPLKYIIDFVKRKATWITKNKNYFKDVQPEIKSEKQYVSGENYKYLGKQYRLKVEESYDEKVKYVRGFIHLYVNDKSNYRRKEKLINDWLRERAAIVFEESLDKIYPIVGKYKILKPEILIREMKARWGSCLKDSNTILLNFELIKAPKYCIEYVILHEIIHFKYENHDSEFYNFLTSLMPDWEKRKQILDEEIVRYL